MTKVWLGEENNFSRQNFSVTKFSPIKVKQLVIELRIIQCFYCKNNTLYHNHIYLKLQVNPLVYTRWKM